MAPRNLSFSPSPEASSQNGADDGSQASYPQASTSTLPPPPPPPPPPPAPEPRKRKPSLKGAPDAHTAAVAPPPKPKAKPKAQPKAPSAATAPVPPGAGGPAPAWPATGRGSRGGKKPKPVVDAVAEPSNKYKDKFLELRGKFDQVSSTRDANQATLTSALARLEKVQNENDAFLSSFITNLPLHPSLSYYLDRSTTPPPPPPLSPPPAPAPAPKADQPAEADILSILAHANGHSASNLTSSTAPHHPHHPHPHPHPSSSSPSSSILDGQRSPKRARIG